MSIRDMVARHSDFDETRDFIPTPPYATRAFYRHVAPEVARAATSLTAWDPAAGHGHMCRVMQEVGHSHVRGTDINAFEPGGVTEQDFLQSTDCADVIITNPPYKLLNEFIRQGLDRANTTLALLVRVQALEGQKRYADVFSVVPPTRIAFFSDRIPFKSGVVVRKAPKMFFHCWLYWNIDAMRRKMHSVQPPMWIPPTVQQELEKDEDYVQ